METLNMHQPDEVPAAKPSLTETRNAADHLSTLLSWLLVPLLIPFYATLLLFGLSPLQGAAPEVKTVVCLIIFAINVALPMALVYLLKLFGLVNDIGLNQRRERLIPYIITILAFGGSGWFMASKGAQLWVVMFFIGGGVAALINMLINFRWKISAHAAAVAGIIAMLIRLRTEWAASESIMTWTIIWILLAGLLGSARIWLGRHTVWQVLAGYAVGFLSVYLLTMI